MPAKKIRRKETAQQRNVRRYQAVDVWQERVAELTVILLMCVLPMFLGPKRYIGLTGQKFWFFFTCMCFILLCVLLIWIYRRGMNIVPPEKKSLTVIDWAVLGFMFITLLSAVTSPFKGEVNVWIGKEEPNGRYDGAVTQCFFAAAFLVVAKWYKPRMRDFCIFGVSVIIISLLGIFQFYGMDFFKLYPNDVPRYYVSNFYRISFRSTLGNINILSTYACVSILLCGFLYVKIDTKWRYLWLAASALGVWLMLLARSDSGMFGTVVAVALAVPFIICDMKSIGRLLILGASAIFVIALHTYLFNVRILAALQLSDLYIRAAGCVIMLTGGLAAVKFGKQPEPDAPFNRKICFILLGTIVLSAVIGLEFVGRNKGLRIPYQIREIMHGRFEDHYVSNRMFIWRHAFMAFPDYPAVNMGQNSFIYALFGTGPDTFRYALAPEAHSKVIHDKAHNEYIQILICQGIFGITAYLTFLGGVLVKAVKKIPYNPLLMAVTVTFAGYCVQAFFNISLPIASQMMWVVAGIIVSITDRHESIFVTTNQ